MFTFVEHYHNSINMNKLYSIFLLLILPFFWVSCDKEVELLDDYQDITIVYGLINPNDSISYIRIEKAFLSDGDIYQAAQVPDSNLYPYKLNVRIYSQNTSIIFDTITVYNKQEGIFYAPKMQVYYAVTDGKLNTEESYNLEITNPKTGDVVTSSTKLIDGSSIRFDYPNFSISFENDKSIEFKTIPDARLYQLNIRFHYTEGLINGSDTAFSEHYVDWVFPAIKSQDLYGGDNMDIPYIGEQFYSNLINTIPYKDNVVRFIGQCEVILSTADDTFDVYLEVNKPSTSIIIERPSFTNIENGYGIFATRSNGGGLYNLNLQSKGHLKSIEELNFVR